MFGIAVMTLLATHLISECLVPDSSFLLMSTQQATDDGSSSWILATHVGNRD